MPPNKSKMENRKLGFSGLIVANLNISPIT